MRWVPAFACAAIGSGGARAADDPTAVAALVASRCAPCHSPAHPDAAREPRALRAWAGAVDLASVVATVVVPGDPGESDLYLSVDLDEMPPADSGVAALTVAEKALLHAWITAGAPLPAPPPDPAEDDGAASPETEGVAGEDPSTVAPPTSARIPEEPSPLELVGRLHPLAVHFPIALLLAAVPAALFARLRGSATARAIAEYCTVLGAAGAVVGAALGWCAHEAGAGSLQPELLERHEWSGYATAGLALLAVAAAAAARRGRRFGRWYLPLLLATAGVVSLAGHFGGMLVWGEDFLPLPWPF